MIRRFRAFLRGLSTTRTGTLGVALTTSSFLLLVFLLLLQQAGVMGNSYSGLLTFLLLPALFLLGLLLIPIGWYKLKKRTGLSTEQLLHERFSPDDMIRSKPLGSGIAMTVAGLTVVNLLLMGFGGAAILHHMDSPEFCGTTCHTVMNPEWVTYRTSPHAHVACVECHVGEGTEALIDAKLNGLRQMWLVTTGGYNRPIPTPVHTLRPARETCEKCHWAEKKHGRRLKLITRYQTDEASTPLLYHAQHQDRIQRWGTEGNPLARFEGRPGSLRVCGRQTRRDHLGGGDAEGWGLQARHEPQTS